MIEAGQEPAVDVVALHRRPNADHGRRDPRHTARQQQRLLPGQRDLVGGLGRHARRARGLRPRRSAPASASRPPGLPGRRPSSLGGPSATMESRTSLGLAPTARSSLTPSGSTQQQTLAMYLDGRGIRTRGSRGEAVVDDSFCSFCMPASRTFSDPSAGPALGVVVRAAARYRNQH